MESKAGFFSWLSLSRFGGVQAYLEDHPRPCKWLISMVIVSPLNGLIPLPNGRTSWLVNRVGVANYWPVGQDSRLGFFVGCKF